MTIGSQTIASQTEVETSQPAEQSHLSERRLWAAVLLQALQDWRFGNLRQRKAAEKFFFEKEQDFANVCLGAGFEPTYVAGKIRKMKSGLRQPAVAIIPGVRQLLTAAA